MFRTDKTVFQQIGGGGVKIFSDFLLYMKSLFWPSYVPLTWECNIYYWVVFENNSFSILLMFDSPLPLSWFSIFTSSKLIFYWAKRHKWNTDMHFPNSELSMNLFQYKRLFRQEEI